MDVPGAYASWSPTYDSDPNLTRDLDGSVTRKLLGEKRYRRILELGCGTGKNTEHLAPLCDELLALDFTPEMLQRARARVPSSHVHFVRADLTTPWPCIDRYADLISSNLVLEHIQNLDFVFAEASRTLAEGGRVLISELHPFRQYGGTKATFVRGEKTVEIAAYTHHISDFLSAAERQGLGLAGLNEWWHELDTGKLPRLVTMLFQKR